MKASDKGLVVRMLNATVLVLLLAGLAGCGENFSRDEFTQLAMHKTEAEVKSALGKPSWISDGNPKTWIYYRKTYDAENQQGNDYSASLRFATDAATGQDKVVDVEFSSTRS